MSPLPGRPDRDERPVLAVRRHGAALALPLALLPVTVGLLTYAELAAPAGRWQPAVRWGALLAAAVLLGRGTLWPWLRWRGGRVWLSDRRVVVCRGVRGRPVAQWDLAALEGVVVTRRFSERLLGAGSLRCSVAGRREPVWLVGLPAPVALAQAMRTAAAERRAALAAGRIPSLP